MAPNDYSPTDISVAINQAHGTKIEANHAVQTVANSVRDKLAYTAGSAQSAINKTQRAAVERVAKVAGRAQGAVDQTLLDLTGALQSVVESAIVPLVQLDIPLPSQRVIANIRAQQKPIQPIVISPPLPPSPGESLLFNCTCDVHKFPTEIEREQYRFLARKLDHTYTVCNASTTVYIPDLQVLTFVASPPQWWQAELCCHLLNDCKWTWELVQTYWQAIIRVQLFHGEGNVNMGALCANAADALAALLTEINAG